MITVNRRYFAKAFFLQLLIVLIYLGISSYKFVVSKQPDPIEVGILQWIFVGMHILCVVIYFLVIKKDKQSFGSNLIAMFVIVFIFLALSNIIWEWLWHQRG